MELPVITLPVYVTEDVLKDGEEICVKMNVTKERLVTTASTTVVVTV